MAFSFSNEYFHHVRVCSDDGIVVHDDLGDLTKYSRDGDFIWRIKRDPLTSPVANFCLDSSDLIYCATNDRVNVYLPSGAFSHVLVGDLSYPRAIAIDGDNYVHLGFESSIRVFTPEGTMIHEYGRGELRGVKSIAISEGNPQLVVAAESVTSSELFVFNIAGSFLYTITVAGMDHICDASFGPDNSLWIAEWAVGVVCIPTPLLQLPPPLSYLCELSILPHLNELPVALLPPRLAGLFEKWTRPVTVEVKYGHYSLRSRPISLETIELKVQPNVPLKMVKWLICKKMNFQYSTISFWHWPSRHHGVDFEVTVCDRSCGY